MPAVLGVRVTLPNTYRTLAALCPDSVASACSAPFLHLAFCVRRGRARSGKGGDSSGVKVAGHHEHALLGYSDSPRKWCPVRSIIHILMTLQFPEFFYLLGEQSFEWLDFKLPISHCFYSRSVFFFWPVFISLPRPFLHHCASWPWPRLWLSFALTVAAGPGSKLTGCRKGSRRPCGFLQQDEDVAELLQSQPRAPESRSLSHQRPGRSLKDK